MPVGIIDPYTLWYPVIKHGWNIIQLETDHFFSSERSQPCLITSRYTIDNPHDIPIYINGKKKDPKMEVLCHIRPYVAGIFPYIGLRYGRYLQFRFLKFPLIISPSKTAIITAAENPSFHS